MCILWPPGRVETRVLQPPPRVAHWWLHRHQRLWPALPPRSGPSHSQHHYQHYGRREGLPLHHYTEFSGLLTVVCVLVVGEVMRDCVYCVWLCWCMHAYSMSVVCNICWRISPKGGDCGAHWSGEVIPDTGAVPDHRGSWGPHLHWWSGHCSAWPPWAPLQNHHHTPGQCREDMELMTPEWSARDWNEW